MKRIMVDLETFGTSKNACVVQIGACDFGKLFTFKRNIDGRDAQKNGAVIDADTVYWWLQQSQSAQLSVGAAGIPERQAFSELNDFLENADEIWSHATFDFVIIMEALRRLGIKPKFSYRASRDIRTLVSLARADTRKRPRAGVHHDALDDCFYQVDYCLEAIRNFKLGDM